MLAYAGVCMVAYAVGRQLLPRVALFKPDLIFVSAGFDGHKDDLQGNGGGLLLRDQDYEWITQKLVQLADNYSGGRLISVLEGGYHVPEQSELRVTRSGAVNLSRRAPSIGALASSVAAHVQALVAR